MLRRFVPLIVMVLTPGLELTTTHAQDGPPEPISAVRTDSIRILGAARAGQANFERTRRRYLPVTWSSTGGRCDERIGRFCLTHDGGEEDWKIPPERAEVRVARSELIAELEAARVRLPGDRWINGQLVRYRTEERRYDEAIAAADSCRGSDGWCDALLGFAFHYAGKPGEAETAFATALNAMDYAERASWEDLSVILSGPPAAAYRRLASQNRGGFERRFWELADPLFTRPGNELRSEHLARRVWERLQENAESPEGGSWSGDQGQVLLRYGWPLGWERVESSPGQAGPPPLIAHLGSSPFYLLPPADALLAKPSASEWDVANQRPRAEYEIPLADSIATWIFPLDHQFAVFQRQGAPLLVAAWALPADGIPIDVEVRSALGVLVFDEPGSGPEAIIRETTGRRGVNVSSLPVGAPVVASLELVLPESRRIARARRFFAPPPDRRRISDLLIIDPDTTLPDSLAAALPKARGSTTVRAGEEIAIFWELYDVDDRAPTFDVTLRFARSESTGVLRRIAELVGLARESVPVRLEWEEPVPDGIDVLPRSLALRIPPSAAGDYTLELTATPVGEAPVVARRSVRVIR